MRSQPEDEFRVYVLRSRGDLVRAATFLAAGDRHLAEDLVQTTLTRLYLAWPRVRRSQHVDGYARRILTNALIDDRRSRARRPESVQAEVPEHAAVDAAEGPDFAPLYAALAELPAAIRSAVVFRHLYDLSVRETADALNCSEGNVRSQTARGLAKLRLALSAQAPPVPPTHPTSRSSS
jgi:RNA polymerase sigma-70 factor (sigma-E family)